MEQYGRRQNVEIHDPPYSPSERFKESLEDLGGNLGIVGFHSSENPAVNRLPAKHYSMPPIIVRVCSVHVKEPLLLLVGDHARFPVMFNLVTHLSRPRANGSEISELIRSRIHFSAYIIIHSPGSVLKKHSGRT